MKFLSNRIFDVKKTFHLHLAPLYETREIDSIVDVLLQHYTGLKKTEYLLEPSLTINESALLHLSYALKRLQHNEPIQYIIGHVRFDDNIIMVNKNVLIPRPETEELVVLLANDFKDSKRTLNLVDLCCGSGCIAIALKKRFSFWNVFAMDISQEALNVAVFNAQQNKTEINFFCDDILEENNARKISNVDLIVSNPPYVCVSEKRLMRKNVLDYEPEIALFVHDESPLQFYQAIINFSKIYLNKRGMIFFEINERFGQQLSEMLLLNGFSSVNVRNDIHDKQRFISGIKEE